MKKCEFCGTKLKKSWSSCPVCGRKTPTENENDNHNINKVILLIIIIVGIIAAFGYVYFFLGEKHSELQDNVSEVIAVDLTEKVVNQEVNFTEIASSILYLELYDNHNNIIGSASGVPIGDKIITNYHVIEGTCSIKAYNSNGEFESSVWSTSGYDKVNDLAILNCKNQLRVTPVALGNSSELHQGDKVYAIGYPLGISNTLSDGIVSSIYKDENGVDIIQITAPISAGSSGGALINEKGELVGIVCASYKNGQNMNIAVPIDIAKNLLNSDNNAVALSEEFENYLASLAVYSPDELSLVGHDIVGKEIFLEGYISPASGYSILYCFSDNSFNKDKTYIYAIYAYKLDFGQWSTLKKSCEGDVVRLKGTVSYDSSNSLIFLFNDFKVVEYDNQ